MRKTFFGLAGFLLGMIFVVNSSSGYIATLIPTPAPKIQQEIGKINILDKTSPAPLGSKKHLKKKQKPSESYVNQLSALRYVMRSA